MPKCLSRVEGLYYYDGEIEQITGHNPEMHGDCSRLRGDCSGLRGDCSRLRGDCSRLSGYLSNITKEEREKNPDLKFYIIS